MSRNAVAPRQLPAALSLALTFCLGLAGLFGLVLILQQVGGSAASTAPPSPSRTPEAFVATGANQVGGLGSESSESLAAKLNPQPVAETEPEGTVVAHALVDIIEARDRPETDGEVVATMSNPTQRGGPLVFQALGLPTDGWIEVLLPVRPNGTTGWIPVGHVELSRNPYRIDIDLTDFSLVVYREGETVVEAEIGVGETDTPTPLGDFYLIELLRPPSPDGPYGPYAYGLSGFSEVLDEFAGGDAVIGIHGTNRPDLIGQRVSHGCIRLENAVIEELAGFLPLGTPVTIVG